MPAIVSEADVFDDVSELNIALDELAELQVLEEIEELIRDAAEVESREAVMRFWLLDPVAKVAELLLLVLSTRTG